MQLVSFVPLRVWDMPGVQRVKPEAWQQSLQHIKTADWILFPEHWQLSVLLYVLHKRIFPSASSYRLGYSKVEMTHAFQLVAPQNTPYTLIMPRSASAQEQILSDFHYPFVAKEVRNSQGLGVHLIENRRELERYIMRFGNAALRQQGIRLGPIIREYLETQIDRQPAWPTKSTRRQDTRAFSSNDNV